LADRAFDKDFEKMTDDYASGGVNGDVSGFWFLVSGFWFLVSGFLFLVSLSRFKVKHYLLQFRLLFAPVKVI
jgi:hypothetical protein